MLRTPTQSAEMARKTILIGQKMDQPCSTSGNRLLVHKRKKEPLMQTSACSLKNHDYYTTPWLTVRWN